MTSRTLSLLITVLLGLASVAHAQTYGTSLESCDGTGTLITVGQDVDNIIEAGGCNVTYRLDGGTHTLNDTLAVPECTAGNGITIKPDGTGGTCEAVTLAVATHIIDLNDYAVIAGLNITTTVGAAIRVFSNTANTNMNVTIRNNNIDGDDHAIRIEGNTQNITVQGNQLSNDDNGSTIRIVNNGSHRPDDIFILSNHFDQCTTVNGDCIEVSSATDYTIDNNKFNSTVDENHIDLKTTYGTATISNNYFLCSQATDSCLLIQGTGTPDTALRRVEYNFFDGSHANNPMVSAATQSTPTPMDIEFFGNIFDASSTAHDSLRFGSCQDCLLEHNVFDNGALVIGAAGNPTNLTIRNNIFHVADIDDRTSGTWGGTCGPDNLFTITGGFGKTCTSGPTGNPLFVSPSTDNFNVTAASPALGAGHDGSDLGSHEVPTISGCEAMDANTVNVNFNVPAAYQPLSLPVTARFAVRGSVTCASNCTETNTVVQGQTQVKITVSDTLTSGDTVDVAMPTAAAVQDSINIGGDGEPNTPLNSHTVVVSTPVTCTNSIAGSGVTLTQTAAQRYGSNRAEGSNPRGTCASGTGNCDWQAAAGDFWIHRFCIGASGGNEAAKSYTLQARKCTSACGTGCGSWTTVDNTCDADPGTCFSLDGVRVQGVSVTDQGVCGGTFLAGQFLEQSASAPALAINSGQELAQEYSLKLFSGLSVGNCVEYRSVEDPNTALNTYTVEPRVTVREPFVFQ